MERGRVLLDLDGCIRNLVDRCSLIYRREVDPDSHVTHKDITQFNFNNLRAFSKLKNPNQFFFRQHARELFTLSELYEQDAPQIVAMIRESYEVCIATCQTQGNEKYTLEWLERVELPYDSIYFGEDKSRIAADIALDDCIDYLAAYRKAGIAAVCMDREWNQDWYGMRVRSLRVFERLLGL